MYEERKLYNMISIYRFLFCFSEGKDAAKEFECKYTEVSALLNHKVDELLVGILRQIRLKSKRKKKHSCKVGCAKDVMTKFFHIDRIFSKSCENMMVL